jgi:nucleotide-binding universal stress UspA family protein
MTDEATTDGTGAEGRPRTILLATDLSARCDRALDRAVLLSAEWDARLVVVHVIENEADAAAMLDAPPDGPAPDAAGLARRQLVRDVGAVAEAATLVIETGRPADGILRTARREGAGLIVLGIARDELLGRYALGTTVDRLLRGAPAPLLIVEARARASYRHVVVATDFSETARHALETAARLFPARRMTVFHAFEPTMEGLVPDVAAYRREARAVAIAEGMRFIADAALPAGMPEPELHVEQGEAAGLLRAHVRGGGADLVVLGSHGRSAIFEIFIGSVAKRILDHLPCDALLVREPRAASEDA